MAARKNTADSNAENYWTIAEECYATLALLAGARGIVSETEELVAPDEDAMSNMSNVGRLLREAIDRLKEIAERAGECEVAEAANG